MTMPRQPLSIDAAQRAVDTARERTRDALIAAWQDTKNAQTLNDLQDAIDRLLLLTSNLSFAATVKTIDYVAEHHARHDRAQDATMSALGKRQETHAGWLTKHDRRLDALDAMQQRHQDWLLEHDGDFSSILERLAALEAAQQRSDTP